MLPSPLTGEGEGGGEHQWSHIQSFPPSQPFPATVSVEGRQLNGAPFPATASAEGRLIKGGPFPASATAEGRQLNGAPSPARGEGA